MGQGLGFSIRVVLQFSVPFSAPPKEHRTLLRSAQKKGSLS